MVPLTLPEARLAVMGRTQPFYDGTKTHRLPEMPVTAVSTDTRTVTPGSLFVALRGERFDGHKFVEQARLAGAIGAVVEARPADVPADFPIIEVADTRKALGKLANFVRRRFRHTKVIAIAGSNGKTGTKHLIHAALGKRFTGTISPKSFNNDIGVPLTLFPVESRHDYVVVECGTNHPGEIERLSRIAEPDVAVITNAGPEHLEFLHDLDGVRRENAAIASSMPAGGCLIINGDDRALVAACGGFAGRKVTFGLDKKNDLWADEVSCDFGGVGFRVNGSRLRVQVPLLGRHVASNALAAIAVARRFGVTDEQMLAGLREATGPAMRLEPIEMGGIRFLNDAYNANPASVLAALETLNDLPHPGRKIAVLGDMLELGAGSDDFHREAGRQVMRCRIDALYCVGPLGALIAAGAVRAGMSSQAVEAFADATQAGHALRERLRPEDLVLLKGSRGVGLERVLKILSSGERSGE